ncbi:MAG: ATP-dependent DNA helicase RecG [Methylococcaceae bacterium]|nr:ATP-dependent DNA helicase RecG [Methylococcaceae bacterium]
MELLNQPDDTLTGVGKQSAQKLTRLGINVVRDLLFHLPLRYEDRTRLYPIGSLHSEMNVLICGKVEFIEATQGRRASLICRISDDSGFINLRFFHFNARQLQQLSVGTTISCFGEVRFSYTGLEIVHPEYQVIASPEHCRTEDRLTPVYPLTEGLNQNTIRKAIAQTLSYCLANPAELIDWLPAVILERYRYPSLLEALQTLHAPSEKINANLLSNGELPALKRLAFEELLAHHLSLRTAKVTYQTATAPPLQSDTQTIQRFLQQLPFKLTGAQQRVITEISADCAKSHPMLRLIQGDVGSGKTVVSAYAALLALSAGFQVALMAPTELLAEQHHRNFQAWFAAFDIYIVYLTGQVKGKARVEALQTLADGSAGIIIGTHALFQENVQFKKLGLVIIDEQHRFGVHQRMALRDKGQAAGIRPHQLVMTATPIPRTLAMLQYSDLDISIIDELPPGRKPIVTSVIPSERRQDVINRINQWVMQKKQAYWVCTLIAESDVLECEAAEKTFENLTAALPILRVALIHGRMKPSEKEAVMLAFKNHSIDLLVATTVIEVGVDVANASLMIIENPERLGLSQLHQLRGRVGRGSHDSFCLLMYQSPLSNTARERLGILRETQDGFIIAEKDLQLRGPGEVMGTRQTGQMQFKIADLARDLSLLENVQQTADLLLTESPAAIEPLIKRWIGTATHYAEV